MAERVLSTRELNRAVLARQLLLERSTLTPERAVERVAGLQTQYAPSGYVGLWSRLAGFRREALSGALLGGRVVQGWVMRATIHMVSAADYPPLTEGLRAVRRDWWLRAAKPPPDLDMEAVADALRGHLAAGALKQCRFLVPVCGRPRAPGPRRPPAPLVPHARHSCPRAPSVPTRADWWLRARSFVRVGDTRRA